RSKHKRTFRRVPLSPLLMAVLREWLSVHPGGPYLFCQSVVVAHSKTKRSAATPVTRDEVHDHFKRTLAESKWKVLWSSPRKVDTELRVIRTVHTPPARRTPTRSDGVDHCRKPRCTRRAPHGLRLGWRSPRRERVPSSARRRSSPSARCPSSPRFELALCSSG